VLPEAVDLADDVVVDSADDMAARVVVTSATAAVAEKVLVMVEYRVGEEMVPVDGDWEVGLDHVYRVSIRGIPNPLSFF